MEVKLQNARFLPEAKNTGHDGAAVEKYERGFDDSGWMSVVLPHDWSASMPFDRKCSSGTGYLPGGVGWYRIPFDMPAGYEAGDCATLHFDGVYKHSRVWCNGYYIGAWANGHTAFDMDVSHAVRYDGENVVAVRVEHEDLADSRWYNGSGINRSVTLIMQKKLRILRRENIFVTENIEPDESRADATVSMQVLIGNHEAGQKAIRLVQRLMDSRGCEAALSVSEKIIGAGEAVIFKTRENIHNARLWSEQSPELYIWRTELYDVTEGGRLTDTLERRVGIRTVRFDADEGFFINGRPVRLKGVCLHEDAGALGTAVPANVWRRRLYKLRDMGANTIRMSHNPHSRELYDLCDEMGFFVIDEVFDEWEGPKNKWWQGHNVYPPRHDGYFKDYPQWHERDVEAFVVENRNRPSIIMWSIGNEIDYPNDPYCHPSFETMTGNNDANKPEDVRRYNPNRPNAERLSEIAAHLAGLVRQYDATRPVSLASAFPELSSNIGLFDSLDVIGYNYKEHLYEQDHARFRDKPIFGSENGHRLADWQAVTEHKYIAGQCIWTGIDYLGETPGWPQHGSGAGMLTTAGFPKADYYFRKALWSEAKSVALMTAREESRYNYETYSPGWNYIPGEEIIVRIFTNAARAELILNGRSLGVKEPADTDGYVWRVPFEPGVLEAVADGIRDRLETTGTAVHVGLKCVDERIIADGAFIVQIEAVMEDMDGRRVCSAEEELFAEVVGEGALCAIDSGNLRDTVDYTAPYRRPYEGRMMIYVRVTDKPGKIRVRVSGGSVRAAELILESQRGMTENGTV